MNIYSMICAGKYHPVNGEDFQFHHHLDDNWFVGAVMDGCSSGKESHFASILYGKSLSKTCRMFPDFEEKINEREKKILNNQVILEWILQQLFEDIKKIKKTLFLNAEEMLSTLLLLVFNKNSCTSILNISGDGIFACNGIIEEIDQNNMPDYMGYHLDTDFEDWFQNHTESMTFDHVHDMAIATDGLGKLRKNPMDYSQQLNPLDFFLIRDPQDNKPIYFQKQLDMLLEKNEYIAFDDISMIRVIL